MSGKMYETFDRAYLREAEKMRDEAEAREDYELRCTFEKADGNDIIKVVPHG